MNISNELLIAIIIIIIIILLFAIFKFSQSPIKGSSYRIFSDLGYKDDLDARILQPESKAEIEKMKILDEKHNKYIKYLCEYISSEEVEYSKSKFEESRSRASKSKEPYSPPNYIVVGNVHGSILQLFLPLKQARIIKSITFENGKFKFTILVDSKGKEGEKPKALERPTVIYCGDMFGRAKHSLTVEVMITFLNIYNLVNSANPNRIVWVYGDHDVGFFQHFVFGKYRTNDVYNVEYADISTSKNIAQLIKLLRENIVNNPYPCIYYSPTHHIQVSHTLIPLRSKFSPHSFVPHIALDTISYLFKDTLPKFKELFNKMINLKNAKKAERQFIFDKIDALSADIYQYFAVPHSPQFTPILLYSDKAKYGNVYPLEIVDAIFNENSLYPLTYGDIAAVKNRCKNPAFISKYGPTTAFIAKTLIRNMCSEMKTNMDVNKDAYNSWIQNLKSTEEYQRALNIRGEADLGPSDIRRQSFTSDTISQDIDFINSLAKYVVIPGQFSTINRDLEHLLFRHQLSSSSIANGNYFKIGSGCQHYFISHTSIGINNSDIYLLMAHADHYWKELQLSDIDPIHRKYLQDRYNHGKEMTKNDMYHHLNAAFDALDFDIPARLFNYQQFADDLRMLYYLRQLKNQRAYPNFLKNIRHNFEGDSYLTDVIKEEKLVLVDVNATAGVYYKPVYFDETIYKGFAESQEHYRANDYDFNELHQLQLSEVGRYMAAFVYGKNNGDIIASKVYMF